MKNQFKKAFEEAKINNRQYQQKNLEKIKMLNKEFKERLKRLFEIIKKYF